VETALDFFQARYHANQQGRFLSADPGQAGVDIKNPQSWNGYAYTFNNPLSNIDPSGLSCIAVTTQTYDEEGNLQEIDSTADNSDGLGCATAGVGAGSPGDSSTLNQGQTNAQVNAQNPSDLEYLWTISTNQIPIYASNDVLLNPNAQKILSQVGRALPTVCAGGGFGYAGVEAKLGNLVHMEALALLQYDSKTGGSHGGLVGAGAGSFTVGFESMRNWSDWSVTNSVVGLGGSHIGEVDLGGIAEPTTGGITLGGYAGVGSYGGGGYVTLSAGECKP
jgi:RHS repeat-associated protein